MTQTIVLLNLTPEIAGECKRPGFKDCIEITNYIFGYSSTIPSADGRHRPGVTDLLLNTLMGRATPQIFAYNSSGSHIQGAVLTVLARREPDGEEQKALEFRMKDLVVSSASASGLFDNRVPTLRFSLNFLKIEERVYV